MMFPLQVFACYSVYSGSILIHGPHWTISIQTSPVQLVNISYGMLYPVCRILHIYM